MSPFSEQVRDEIRRRDNWTCTDCGKSSFEKEKWLLEASHEGHQRDEGYNTPERGKTRCRICHLMHDLDMGDLRAVNLTANRIWNTGIRHFSEYERDPNLLTEDRIQFSELLTALGLQGKVHITETVQRVGQLRAKVDQMRKK